MANSNDAREGKIKMIIKKKMKVLSDFNICQRYDPAMEKRLRQAIDSKPDKDPREVLDYYCRPMIHEKIFSWD